MTVSIRERGRVVIEVSKDLPPRPRALTPDQYAKVFGGSCASGVIPCLVVNIGSGQNPVTIPCCPPKLTCVVSESTPTRMVAYCQ